MGKEGLAVDGEGETHFYYVGEVPIKKERFYRIVFCMEKKNMTKICVITIYRIKK